MKKLFILLALIPFLVNGQTDSISNLKIDSTYFNLFVTPPVCYYKYKPIELPKRHTHAEAWKVIAVFTASTALDAVGDALNDNGKKTAGHLCNALSIGTLLSYPLIGKVDRERWWVYPITLVFIRASIFDIIYNGTRGLPLNYVGSSSLTDKFQQKVGFAGGFVRGAVFIVGVSLPLNKL